MHKTVSGFNVQMIQKAYGMGKKNEMIIDVMHKEWYDLSIKYIERWLSDG